MNLVLEKHSCRYRLSNDYLNDTQTCLYVLCITAAIAACGTLTPTAVHKVYQCEQGTTLAVTFITQDVTTMRGGRNSIPRYQQKPVAIEVILADGKTFTLPIQTAASGFRYGDRHYTLRGKGNEALWFVGDRPGQRCRTQ